MKTINISITSRDWRARKLSNFSNHAFRLGSKTMASVEGFIQGIKFPKHDPRRNKAFKSAGYAAKKFSSEAEGKFVWWGNKQIIFCSKEHLKIIEKAIEAKFEQNLDARLALLATEGSDLIHYTGRPEMTKTSLPAKKLCEILTKIRKDIENRI